MPLITATEIIAIQDGMSTPAQKAMLEKCDAALREAAHAEMPVASIWVEGPKMLGVIKALNDAGYGVSHSRSEEGGQGYSIRWRDARSVTPK